MDRLLDFSWLGSPNAWIGLVTLTFLQIVLGVDNIVLLTILSSQLKEEKQAKARQLGLMAAMASRLILLVALLWVSKLVEQPFAHILGIAVSGKSLILIVGGIFLMGKATTEIHSKLEGDEEGVSISAAPTLNAVLAQIFVLDVVFSLDSVITAIGMVKIMPIQIISVILATLFMMAGIHSLADFVDRHPTVKMLALSFLILIGFNLVAEGLGYDIPRGYTYFAMAWSISVEILNLRLRKAHQLRMKQSEPNQAIDPGS